MVVGEQAARAIQSGWPGPAASSRSATCRSSGVVTLRFSAGARDDAHAAAGALDERGLSVAACELAAGTSSARSSAARRKTCGVCTAHSSSRVERPSTTPSTPTLLDRVGHRSPAMAASARPSRVSPPSTARASSARQQRPRGVMHEHRIAPPGAAASAARTEAERDAPPATPEHPRRRRDPGRQCDDDGSTSSSARSASMLHCIIGRPRSSTSALGRPAPSRSPRPAATTSATVMLGGAVAHAAIGPGWALPRAREPRSATWRPRPPSGCWPNRRAARRGSPPPPPRPCRART